jgi:homoserine/homoserine lactone efflux protein
MTLKIWVLFVITEAVLDLTPGPAVLLVLSQAVRRGASKSVWASLGILSANAMYFVLSATSLGAIIASSYKLFQVIKWAGAAYLVYLGLKCFFSNASTLTLEDKRAEKSSSPRIWLDGFLLQAANPNSLLFFTAILPQFLDPHASIALQVLILGVTSITVEFFVLFAYGQLAGRAVTVFEDPRLSKTLDRVAGSLLIAAGLGLARLNRN